MGFCCGIVGLPNVGKSTLFNALTQSAAAATENYPFCTIEPNVGRVPVPDPRLQQLASIVKPEKIVPTFVEFVDIAGLVKGASQGEGLGNKFLAHIRESDAIIHVVRCFENDNVTHVSGRVDPLADVETIATELCLVDLETLDRATQRLHKRGVSGDQEAIQCEALYTEIRQSLDAGKPIRTLNLSAEKKQALAPFRLLTIKPQIYVANIGEADRVDHSGVTALEKLAATEGADVLAMCIHLEEEMAGMPAEEQMLFLKDLGLQESGLNQIVRAGYHLLGLQTFFTAGPKEVRAWTIEKGALAPRAAGAIHSDFERGFIRLETASFEDYMAHQGEHGAKRAGRWRQEGKDYVVCDGDVVLVRFHV